MAVSPTLAPPRASALLAGMRGRRIVVVGDVMIDEWIWGAVTRISPEAPVPIVNVSDHSFTLGGAGNVANNLRALGAEVAFVAVVGDDAEAERVRSLFTAIGVETDALITVRDRPTTRKTRIVAQGQQVVRADWESRAALVELDRVRVRDAVRRLAAGADAIICSDYAKGLLDLSVVAAARTCPLVVADPKPANIEIFAGVDVVTPNVAETARATGIAIVDDASLVRAGEALLERLGCRYVVVTRGEAGMTLFGRDGSRLDVPSVARTVFDVSGAGDTVVAVLTLALAAGIAIETATELANLAAGAVVEKLGTATATPDEIVALLVDA